jgi:hypothetical protein
MMQKGSIIVKKATAFQNNIMQTPFASHLSPCTNYKPE